MADYYPLLAKAAAGLSGASPDARQAMYARARKALLGQLRAIDPPVAEADIANESAALDAAIARVETELFSSAPSVPETPPVAVPPPPDVPPVAAEASEPTPVASEPSSSPPAADEPPEVEAASRPDVEDAPPPEPDIAPVDPDLPPAETPAHEPVVFPAESKSVEPVDERSDLRIRPRERPLAPKPPAPASQMRRVWILGGVAALLVAAVAATALKLRGSPDDLARLKPIAAPTAEPAAGNGKIVERVGRAESGAPASQPSSAQTPQAGTGPAANAPATSAPPVTQPPIPVAQRSALLVEAPDLESKVRTFIGTTVWRLDNVSAVAGQPLGTAVHADVDIPDANVRLTMDIRKNNDPALPASNTIEIRFNLGPGSALPGIKQISVPQMRREENPNGDALAGVPVKITDTYFLVGLAQGDFEKRNAELLRSRAWIDIPVQLTDNRVAKITLEKGATGDRIIADALATWAQ